MSKWGWPEGTPRKEGGPFKHKIDARINDKMMRTLRRKTKPEELSKFIRDILEEWMKEHGCARLDIRVTPLNLLSVVDNMVKDEHPNLHTFLPFQGMGLLYLTKKARDRRFIKKAMTTRKGLAYKLLQERDLD